MTKDDTSPFPIQGELGRPRIKSSSIPWWLAKIAYEHYVKLFGKDQSLERIAERGGFGRDELLMLLRKDRKEKFYT
ncbi:hypothetical protein LCGC14_2811190 [marine sediment metagenome]|uniref:Uncharacterized protein n=1 Tax=marine sediment metagenome TaxID=412755 RepID=A0A0F8YJS3_9ZZZZ|nr:hypothetical protein [Pricia sp.]